MYTWGQDEAAPSWPGYDQRNKQKMTEKIPDSKRQRKRSRPDNLPEKSENPNSKLKHDPHKVMLVFDCNGTLTSLTQVRKSKGFGVRPGVSLLRELALSERFGLSLWTSAMKVNLDKMQRKIENVARVKFGCALDRSHCVPAPAEKLKKKAFETVKPLHAYFGEEAGPGLSKVILIDDNADKMLESEVANLLLVPAWHEDRADRVIHVLVEGLLKLDCSKDVRPQIKAIQDSVWHYFQTADPPLKRLSESTKSPSTSSSATVAATPTTTPLTPATVSLSDDASTPSTKSSKKKKKSKSIQESPPQKRRSLRLSAS